MKKVLIGYIIDGKKSGIDKYLLNMLKAIDGKGYQIDFLTNQIDEGLQNQLAQYGSKLYEIPTLKHPVKQIKQIKKILKEGAYEVAYFNISEAFNCTGLLASYLAKTPKRILHSHSSGCDSSSKMRWVKITLHNIAKQLLPVWANTFVTCSDKAAEWMFPKRVVKSGKVELILNGVYAELFAFSQEKRDAIRKQMNWEDKKILMHVGSFFYVKNHPFLLDIINNLRKQSDDYRLVLVGDGPLKPEIERMVQEGGLQNYVEFLGIRSDVADLIQGCDVFALPSHFEGLPLTAVEAQVSGTVCILSANITKDAKISELCEYASIEDVNEWVEKILKHQNYTKVAFENTSGKVVDVMQQGPIFDKLFS